MNTWNRDYLNNRFKNQTENIERQLTLLKRQEQTRRTFEIEYDENLAKFYVYSVFVDSIYLDSREALLEELKKLKKISYAHKKDICNIERFEHIRQNCINDLIKEFTE